MSQQDRQDGQDAGWTGIYVSPMAQRRADFAQACGPLFARLQLADSVDAALGCWTRRGGAGRPAGDRPRTLRAGHRPGRAGRTGGAPRRRPHPPAVPFRERALAAAAECRGPAGYAMTPIEPARLQAVVQRCLEAPGRLRPGRRCARHCRPAGAARPGADGARRPGRGTWPGRAPVPGPGGVAGRAACRDVPSAGWRRPAARGRAGPGYGCRAEPGYAAGAEQPAAAGAAAPCLSPGCWPPPPASWCCSTPGPGRRTGAAEARCAHGVVQALGMPIPADGPGAPRGALSLLFDSGRRSCRRKRSRRCSTAPAWPRWACAWPT
jgi:hypothetical protein